MWSVRFLVNLPERQEIFGQVTKSTWWMPWHEEAMKDVVSCDKLRVGANNRRSGDFRMGQPGTGNAVSLPAEFIGRAERTG
jgi:hypothetical protein